MAALKGILAPLQLQERDFAFLRGLFECRVMTNDHATALYFAGKNEAAKKRLQKIKAAGLVTERPRRAFEPSILFLTHKPLVAAGVFLQRASQNRSFRIQQTEFFGGFRSRILPCSSPINTKKFC
jgi:hypothetical protein